MATSTEKNITMKKNRLQIIRGIPLLPLFKPETIEEVLDFLPQDGDVIIATYPKTGTTWMQYIVLQILSRGESFPTFNDMLEKAVPFLEMTGVAALNELTTRPRVYKIHFSYNSMKSNPKAKIIYVYRKPEDTFASYYHFAKNFDESLNFDEYFEDFLTGNVSYGNYFEHVLSYLKHKDDENILLVSYEKLQLNRKDEILRIAKFLGEEYYIDLLNDESVLSKIIECTSFDYMKKNLALNLSIDPETGRISKDAEERKDLLFFRKGIIGDGKNSLKTEQLQRLKELVAETMKGTEILEEWF